MKYNVSYLDSGFGAQELNHAEGHELMPFYKLFAISA
jgi:hypothetical protein